MTTTEFFAQMEALGFQPAEELGITVVEDPEPTYRIKGTTEDVTNCEWGHTNLKKTVALAVLDSDGNETGTIVYLGVDCAAKAMRTTETRVRNAAASADTVLAEANSWAAEMLAYYGTEVTPSAVAKYVKANPSAPDPAAKLTALIEEATAALAGTLTTDRFTR
jgi:hypothetical protein